MVGGIGVARSNSFWNESSLGSGFLPVQLIPGVGACYGRRPTATKIAGILAPQGATA